MFDDDDYKRQRIIEIQHTDVSLLYHRIDSEHWSQAKLLAYGHITCLMNKKHQFIHQLDGGSHPIAHSQLAFCLEQAARSQQQTATAKYQPASSEPQTANRKGRRQEGAAP